MRKKVIHKQCQVKNCIRQSKTGKDFIQSYYSSGERPELTLNSTEPKSRRIFKCWDELVKVVEDVGENPRSPMFANRLYPKEKISL